MPRYLEEISRAKDEVRERTWELLERGGAARFPGARGRIPNFRGAEEAAKRLAELAGWKSAEVVKANPDSPQLPVRTRALEDGKSLYMAVPRLRTERPFISLRPDRLKVLPRKAASIRGASELGRVVRLADVRPIDLIVCGTVAVNRKGVRVGKGGGYSDLEFALLAERGLVSEGTVIVTTVHPLQVVDEDLPDTEHDFRVDLIATPEETIRCPRTRRPSGILWDHLDEEKISSIPALQALRGDRY